MVMGLGAVDSGHVVQSLGDRLGRRHRRRVGGSAVVMLDLRFVMGHGGFGWTVTPIIEVPDLPDSPIHRQPITSVSFRIEDLPPMEENVVIHGEDHVHWIMEDLFGGTRHTIAPDGTITRNPSDEYEDDQEP